MIWVDMGQTPLPVKWEMGHDQKTPYVVRICRWSASIDLDGPILVVERHHIRSVIAQIFLAANSDEVIAIESRAKFGASRAVGIRHSFGLFNFILKSGVEIRDDAFHDFHTD